MRKWIIILMLGFVFISFIFAEYMEITDIDTDVVVEDVVCEGTDLFCHLNISDENLVLYMPFDVNTSTVYDWSENDNDGTAVADAHWVSTGKYGGAYTFDEVNDWIIVEDDSSLYPVNGDFALLAWIKTTDTSLQVIIDKLETPSGDPDSNYGLYVDTGGTFHFFTEPTNEGGNDVDSNVGVRDGAWHHVVGVRDSTLNKMLLYVDGVNSLNSTDNRADGYSNDDQLYIGARGLDSSFEFRGEIDEVMIFNTALTASQIGQIYDSTFNRFYSTGNHIIKPLNITAGYNRVNVTINESNQNNTNLSVRVGQINKSVENMTGLVLYMPFEWGKAWDISGNGNDGTVLGGAVYSSTSGLNSTGSYNFDGTQDSPQRIEPLSPDPGFFHDAFREKSFCAWVTIDSTQGPNYIYDEGGTINGFSVGYFSGPDQLFASVVDDSVYEEARSLGNYPDGTGWTHVCGVFNDTNISIYVNAVMEKSTNSAFAEVSAHTDGPAIGGNTTDTSIDDVIDRYSWDGQIDEVMIFNRSLSDAEILQIFQRQSSTHQNIQYTPYQNLTSGQIGEFTISTNASFIFPDFRYIADPNNYWSPILLNPILLTTFNVSEGDITPPTITFTHPSDNETTVTTRNWTFINVTTDEAVSDCYLSWNYSSNVSMTEIATTNFNYNKTELINGNYTYEINCNDTSGNFGYNSSWVNISYYPPSCDYSGGNFNINRTCIYTNVTFTIDGNLTVYEDGYINATNTTFSFNATNQWLIILNAANMNKIYLTGISGFNT